MKTFGDRVRGAQVRITIHLAFAIFLVVAVLLPYLTIRTHKERADADQAKHREVTEQRMVERLQSAAGQLALENPSRLLLPAVPLRPVILPFTEIQADVPGVVLDQVRAVGCPIQFKATAEAVLEQGSVCVGLRKSDAAEVRGRLLVTGTFLSANLVPHLFLEAKAAGAGRTVAKRFQDAHRIEITLNEGKSSYQWVLPVQIRIDRRTHRVREDLGLTAYRKDARGLPVTARPDFVGAWFTEGDCIDPGEPAASCIREHAFSIAIPRDRWGRQGVTVKPADLTLDVVISGPDANGKPSTILNSSAAKTAFVPFGPSDLAGYLAPGESLTVTRQRSGRTQELFVLDRDASPRPPGFQTFGALVLSLFGMDLADPVAVSEQRRSFGVRGGSFDMIYRSSPRGLDAEVLSSGAAVAAYAVPMIVLAVLAWVTIDRGVLRRVMRLTGRTRLVSLAIRANGNLNQFDFSALKGRDELGVLATGLDDLLKRIADDVQRNAIRLHHERSMLRAIGHEIRAPLQSLSAVLATSEAGTGYVRRMLKAVAALYGSDSPSDGFESAEMESERMDLADFLVKVAANAHHAGINNVEFRGPKSGVHIRADQAALEDAISHILRNAKRYRPESTPITISLTHGPTTATASIYNAGPPIPEDLLDRIFDYGVSDNKDAADGSEGQGLFVAATYLAKMGGTIAAKNLPVGVEFAIQLPVLAPK